LYAFDEKRIIEVAKVKRDLRHEGGSEPATEVRYGLSRRVEIPLTQDQACSFLAS
jgi:hypothetical protein